MLQAQIAQIKEYLTKRPKPALILVGKPGTGKTFALTKAVEDLHYKLWTVDPLTEDLDEVSEKMRLRPIAPTVIHIPSAETLSRKEVSKLIEGAKRFRAFLVLESTEPMDHEDLMRVDFYKPRARDVVKIAEELKIPFDKIKMHNDIRQVVLAQFGSTGYEEERSATKETERALRTGKYEEVNDTMFSLLLDSAHLNFFGKDLFFFVKAIQVADKCKRGYPLEGFRAVKPTVVSYFLEKLKLSR
jgi:vacuolar-type H+-ATPase subunit F/Vma7